MAPELQPPVLDLVRPRLMGGSGAWPEIGECRALIIQSRRKDAESPGACGGGVRVRPPVATPAGAPTGGRSRAILGLASRKSSFLNPAEVEGVVPQLLEHVLRNRRAVARG
jgi:hypothetical protein